MSQTPPDPDPYARAVVSPEELARRIGGLPEPLPPADREVLGEALLDAQTDVESFLGRPVVPTEYTETERWAYDGVNWNLTMLADEPLISITTVTAETDTSGPTGYYTIKYLAGIDARTDPVLRPIRRFVLLHAQHSPSVVAYWKKVTGAVGEVKSESAEGQSVSYAAASMAGNAQTGIKPGDLTPGSLPTLGSLDRWRVAGRRVYQAPTLASQWPFYGGPW